MVAQHSRPSASADDWPSLRLAEWRDTCTTLHMWTQVVGKVRLALTPAVNHWWHVPLYVTSRGLTTSPIPYGTRTFQIDFDFLDHELRIETTDGKKRTLPLAPRAVADFYRETMDALRSLDINVTIWTTPVEVPDPIPFELDRTHASYDPEYARRFWYVLVQADRVFKEFRGRFLGKASPVHFFWGGFDLAVTRFRACSPQAPGYPGVADSIMLEAYSHEVSSCGFWPGGGVVDDLNFYSYAYSEPAGYRDYPVHPVEATYNEQLGEFVLPYEVVRTAADPDAMLLDFLQSTYEAAADQAAWDRAALERAE